MQQSNVIFANLLIAYVIFITMKGELPQYIDLLRGGGQVAAGATPNNSIQIGNTNIPLSGIDKLFNSSPPAAGNTNTLGNPPDYITSITNGGETEASLNALPDTGQ